MSIDYPVILKESEEGFAVGCPALPGCWSQGATEAEALDNIRDAIREYLAARETLLAEESVRRRYDPAGRPDCGISLASRDVKVVVRFLRPSPAPDDAA